MPTSLSYILGTIISLAILVFGAVTFGAASNIIDIVAGAVFMAIGSLSYLAVIIKRDDLKRRK
jgi:hypothetical protein